MRNIIHLRKWQSGQSLVELLVAIGLATLILPALLTGLVASRGGRAQQDQRVIATAQLKQAQEAVRAVAGLSWSNVETNGTYHPVISGNSWTLVSGTQNIDGLILSVTISDTLRDSSGAIVSSSGTVDLSTKKITILVSWDTPLTSNVTATTYLTRHTNLSHIDTTVEDFTLGASNPATTGITIANADGGEIVLGAGGGGGDWCTPSLTLETRDLPKSGVANAISAIEGKVFAGTGDNSSGVSYASVDITTSYPPSASLGETFDGYKTNDVFGEEDYAYLATDTNSKEVVIINLNEYSNPPTNTKYKEEGYFNAPGNGSGNTVYVAGNYGYMTSGNKFYIFDLSSKSGSRTRVNTSDLDLSGTGVKIFVIGNYAYVATSSTSNQLQIIDITNPVSPTIAGQITVAGLGGKGISVNTSGTRVYLATEQSSSQRELFIINTENKSAPVLVSGGTYDTSGMNPKGVTTVTGNRAIIVGTGGSEQYQVVNISNENSPAKCAGLPVTSGVNGVASVLQSDGYAYSYIITGDASDELKIILGGAGAGGGNYSSNGVFESATFDAGTEVAWNSITATVSEPINTTLQFKIALKDAVSNSCTLASFADTDFVGSDGQSSSYFPSSGGVLPFDNTGSGYENPARCARYRAYLDTTDITQTPVIYDFSFNYSP